MAKVKDGNKYELRWIEELQCEFEPILTAEFVEDLFLTFFAKYAYPNRYDELQATLDLYSIKDGHDYGQYDIDKHDLST